jgi:cytochrome c oxidase cbb3-type subunit IV
MDVNDLRSLTTLLMFAAFIGIVAWAWNGRRRARFDDAAQLPFADDLPAAGAEGEKK